MVSAESGLPDTALYCWCRGLDDGSPMVQCDGCDEWFHVACVGITRQRKEVKEVKGVEGVEGVSCTVVSESGEGGGEGGEGGTEGQLEGQAADMGANKGKETKVGKGKDKNKESKGGKGRGGKGSAIRTSKQLKAAIQDSFFCITCCEMRNEQYPYQW